MKMKKSFLIIALAVLVALMACGCGNLEKSEFSVATNDDNTIDVKADSASEESAKAAGLDTFQYGEGDKISLGDVKAEKIQYMEGVVHAHVPVAAVDMHIYKGLSSIDEGDISFDQNEYKHQWTQNIKGLEVKCFGNREGEATKTIWTVDDYSYAITAYGAGGDDDFGLSADDLSSLINSIQ